MRIFIFKSQTRVNLRAFAGDIAGSKLPDRFGPWHYVRTVPRNMPLPHSIERPGIERAIENEGFQLWRFKGVPEPAAT
jgi:hypothetical protein